VRARFVVPAGYLALALYAWVDFVLTNPDGLANVGLYLVTLPVALIGLALTEVIGSGSFILQPSGFGYYGDHALYYWPSVIVTTALLYWVTAALTRTRG
jgi:hypothetical protein